MIEPSSSQVGEAVGAAFAKIDMRFRAGHRAGPHHCFSSSGSVHAAKTFSRGARMTRRKTEFGRLHDLALPLFDEIGEAIDLVCSRSADSR